MKRQRITRIILQQIFALETHDLFERGGSGLRFRFGRKGSGHFLHDTEGRGSVQKFLYRALVPERLTVMERNKPARTPGPAEANINTVLQLEEEALKQRCVADRIADAIANFVGSIPFVAVHVVWFGVWVGLNAGLVRFDPYPYQLLCMLVS